MWEKGKKTKKASLSRNQVLCSMCVRRGRWRKRNFVIAVYSPSPSQPQHPPDTSLHGMLYAFSKSVHSLTIGDQQNAHLLAFHVFVLAVRQMCSSAIKIVCIYMSSAWGLTFGAGERHQLHCPVKITSAPYFPRCSLNPFLYSTKTSCHTISWLS